VLVTTLPDMFEVVELPVEGGKPYEFEYYLVFAPGAEQIGDAELWRCVRNDPHHLPSFEPPKPWTGDYREGAYGDRQKLIRGRRAPLTPDELEAMRPALEGLHRLETVAYRVNGPMLRFLQRAYEQATFEGSRGLGFLWVQKKTIRRLERLPWTPGYTWTNGCHVREPSWRSIVVARKGDPSVADRTMFRKDMLTARACGDRPFYLDMNFDKRGRVYPLPGFNFTRGDHIRCLFDFAQGKLIGRKGLYCLKVHLFNCATGFDGRPGNMTYAERVAWVDDRTQILKTIGRHAYEGGDVDESFLAPVEDRFQFVRACVELYLADDDPAFITHLPLLFDASSSGIQHYCAALRDEAAGREVNLVPGLPPQDVYYVIGRCAALLVRDDYIAGRDPDGSGFIRAENHRKVAKPVVMTKFYGSSAGGTQRRLRKFFRREDAEGIRREVVRRWGWPDPLKRSDYAGEATYSQKILDKAIEQILPRPAKAMEFLRNLAQVLCDHGRVLTGWRTPSGFPWENRYHEPDVRRKTVTINGKKPRLSRTVGDKPELRESKTVNSVAPNFVHGLDAALVHLTALAAGSIPVMTVHDCFGFLAPDAPRGREIVLDQFARMYLDHDVLAEILARAQRDLPAQLPAPPKHGNLKIEGCRNAEYIIS
jgi:DNA-directed RNA polymerase